MFYVVILAGGSGTRLWPWSLERQPKQLQALFNQRTLLQNTYDRLCLAFTAAHIFVVTKKSLAPEVKKQLKIKKSQILVEPQSIDTTMAIGFAAINILANDPEAIIATVGSDHYLDQPRIFLTALQQGAQWIKQEPSRFLLLGARPTYPETGYGYIKIGRVLHRGFYRVARLKEKPDLKTAGKYIKSGKYLWSMGCFVFQAKQLLTWYQSYVPEAYRALRAIQNAWEQEPAAAAKVLEREYRRVRVGSIDYSLLEKLPDLAVKLLPIFWADVGHWRSVRDILYLSSKNKNVSNGPQVSIDSRGSLFYSTNEKLIATIGLEDMIVVETDKALLVCPVSRAHEVKKLLALLKKQGGAKYL